MKKALIAIAALCILTGCLGKIGKDAVIKYEFISSVKPIPGHEYVDENDSFLAEQDLLKDFVHSMDPRIPVRKRRLSRWRNPLPTNSADSCAAGLST